MKIAIYFHVSDHLGWQELVDDKVLLMQRTGLWDHAHIIQFQLHYDPASYRDWNVPYLRDPRVYLSYTPGSHAPLGETYSIKQLHMACKEQAEDDVWAVFRTSTKGLTHRHDETWPVAQQWNDYIDYWTIEQWKLCYQSLKAGYDLVGANWHPAGAPRGHFSGTVFWARSDYMRTCYELQWPHQVNDARQLEGFSPRHDAEVWIGTGAELPRVLELHHYPHAVVYHVEAPKPEDYRLGSTNISSK